MQQSVERAGKIESLFYDGDQQVNRDGDPELGFDGVFACSIEGLDSQVLLDPLEERFNFPAAFVEIADGGSGQGELVGEKDKALAGVGVAEADSAQMVWIVVAAVIAVESDGLVGENARLLVRRAGVDARCVEVALGASDKKCSGQMDAMKPAIVEVAAIHHIVGSGLENYLVEDFDVVRISSGDADKHGNRSAQIEQRMHFDGGLGGTKMRPGEQTQTQVDSGRVQCISGCVEVHAEALLRVKFAGLKHQPLRQLGIDTPVAALVGFCQSGTPHGRTKAHRVELGWLGAETCFDVPQTLAISQLGKGHGAELFGATEVAHSAVTAIAGHTAGERSPGKKIHQLRKQQLASVQRCLQKDSLEPASRQFQIDTTQKQPQLITDQRVATSELAVNRTVVTEHSKTVGDGSVIDGHLTITGLFAF